jgi:hypothetical protein
MTCFGQVVIQIVCLGLAIGVSLGFGYGGVWVIVSIVTSLQGDTNCNPSKVPALTLFASTRVVISRFVVLK